MRNWADFVEYYPRVITQNEKPFTLAAKKSTTKPHQNVYALNHNKSLSKPNCNRNMVCVMWAKGWSQLYLSIETRTQTVNSSDTCFFLHVQIINYNYSSFNTSFRNSLKGCKIMHVHNNTEVPAFLEQPLSIESGLIRQVVLYYRLVF